MRERLGRMEKDERGSRETMEDGERLGRENSENRERPSHMKTSVTYDSFFEDTYPSLIS